MNGSEPILVAPLFRELSRHLVALLRSLDSVEWHRPTSSSQRNVKDVAAHLLDGSIRRLSLQRDGYSAPEGPGDIDSYVALMAYLHRLNAEWTTALRRLSPRLLIEWIEQTDGELAEFFESLDPFAPAMFPVAWAGEEESANWFDVAREYTEKWHHQQQIYEALAKTSPIMRRELYFPCLDIFMRALPYTLREATAPQGTVVKAEVRGEAGGAWYVVRENLAWVSLVQPDDAPSATFSIGQESAWKFFTKRLDPETALGRFPDIEVEGDAELTSRLLVMVSVMA